MEEPGTLSVEQNPLEGAGQAAGSADSQGASGQHADSQHDGRDEAARFPWNQHYALAALLGEQKREWGSLRGKGEQFGYDDLRQRVAAANVTRVGAGQEPINFPEQLTVKQYHLKFMRSKNGSKNGKGGGSSAFTRKQGQSSANAQHGGNARPAAAGQEQQQPVEGGFA